LVTTHPTTKVSFEDSLPYSQTELSTSRDPSDVNRAEDQANGNEENVPATSISTSFSDNGKKTESSTESQSNFENRNESQQPGEISTVTSTEATKNTPHEDPAAYQSGIDFTRHIFGQKLFI
jgi:hypothetical protein